MNVNRIGSALYLSGSLECDVVELRTDAVKEATAYALPLSRAYVVALTPGPLCEGRGLTERAQ